MLTRYNTCVLVGMRGDSTFLFPFSEKVTNADNRTPALTGAPRARLGHGYGDLKNGDPLPSYQPSTTRKILWRYEYKYERTAVVSPCCARVMSIAYYRKCRSDTKPPASRLPAAARACFFFFFSSFSSSFSSFPSHLPSSPLFFSLPPIAGDHSK